MSCIFDMFGMFDSFIFVSVHLFGHRLKIMQRNYRVVEMILEQIQVCDKQMAQKRKQFRNYVKTYNAINE